MPHAPLLVPDIARSRAEPAVERVRAAMREAGRTLGRPTVVISPHGTSAGVYLRQSADLRAFGVPRASAGASGVQRADARSDVEERSVRELSERWGKPVLDEPPDHGVAVPVLTGGLQRNVIGVAFDQESDPADDAAALASALRAMEHDVVASVNTGAGVSARAPMTQLEGAEELERELRDALSRQVSGLAEIARRLSADGASCCLGPLLVIADLFAGAPGKILAHEWPYGVGYLVATFDGDV